MIVATYVYIKLVTALLQYPMALGCVELVLWVKDPIVYYALIREVQWSAHGAVKNGLWFRGASELPGGIMPTRDQDLKSYLGITIQSVIEEPLALDTKIQQKFFDEISKTYPPTKMGSWWSLAAITFPTAESDKFVVEVSDGDEDNEDIISGYFIVSVRFETQFDANSTIQTTIGDIRINLSK